MKSAQEGSYNRYDLSQKDRQKAFIVHAADQRLSQEQAIDQARLIPKSIVLQFKVVRWVRYLADGPTAFIPPAGLF